MENVEHIQRVDVLLLTNWIKIKYYRLCILYKFILRNITYYLLNSLFKCERIYQADKNERAKLKFTNVSG